MRIGIIAILSVILANCGGKSTETVSVSKTDTQQTYNWKLVTTWPKNYPGLGTAPENFAKKVEAMSGGRLTIKVFGAGQLVPAFEVFDAVNTSVISGPTNPTQFQTVTYSVLSSSGSTYDWTVIGGVIQSGVGTNSIGIMWDNYGTFSLTVIETDINGCLGEEITIIVSIIISSIEEVNNTKILKKITDVLGRETNKKHNTTLFYIYDDGTLEKKITIE